MEGALRPVEDLEQATAGFDPVATLRGRARHAPLARKVDGLIGLLRGVVWRYANRVRGRRIRGGAWLRVYGHAYVGGQGTLVLGRGVVLTGVAIRQVSLFTQTAEAEIRLDDNVTLNGTAVAAQALVHFERDAIAADAYIVDSSMHRLTADRRDPTLPLPPAQPVVIRRNAWISTAVVVLKGVEIGENSVVAACSLVRDSVPPNVLAAGNPCVAIKPLPGTR